MIEEGDRTRARTCTCIYNIIRSRQRWWVPTRNSRLPRQILFCSPFHRYRRAAIVTRFEPKTELARHPAQQPCLIHSTWTPQELRNGASDLPKSRERRGGKLLQQAGHSRGCQACCSGDESQSPSHPRPVPLILFQDLEAEVKREATVTVEPDPTPIPPSEYVNSGRGGAGNFFSRKDEIFAAGNAVSSDDKASLLTKKTLPEVRYSGRGGAGNYNTAENERKRVEAEKVAEEARSQEYEMTVRDVELGLKPPEKAHLVTERLSGLSRIWKAFGKMREPCPKICKERFNFSSSLAFCPSPSLSLHMSTLVLKPNYDTSTSSQKKKFLFYDERKNSTCGTCLSSTAGGYPLWL